MKKQYTKRQIAEAINYWKSSLKKMNEENELDERELSKNEVDKLSKYILDNKINMADILKIDVVNAKLAQTDENIKKAYDVYVNMAKALGFTNKSIPAFHRALKGVFKGQETAAKNPEKAAEVITDNKDKAVAAIEVAKDPAKAADSKDGNDGKDGKDGKDTAPAVLEKVEQAIADDIVDTDEDVSAKEAVKSPVGTLNVLGRFYRIHVNAVKNATKAVSKFLNAKKVPVPDTGISFTNSYIDDDAGTFSFKDEPMVLTLKVEVDRASVKGFRKFMAVLLKESAAKRGEVLDEGIFGTLAAAFGAAKEKGKEKAAESIKKANEELKAQIGVAGLQEYVKRFCGPKLAKLINQKVIFDGMNEDNGELVYKYSVSYNVEQGK